MANESERAAWSAWSHSIQDFWTRHQDRFQDNGGEVLVEAQVTMPHYLFGNFQLGNYLRIYQGLRPVAWVRRQETFAVAIARAFGAHDSVNATPEMAANAKARAKTMFDNLPPAGHALREAVEAIQVDGVPMGDLIYDDVLRNHERATLERKDEALFQAIHSALTHQILANQVLDQRPIRALVVGHIVYTHFGVMVRVALSRNIPVYSRKPATRRFIVRRFDTVGQTVSHECFFTPDELDHLSPESRAHVAGVGRKVINDRFEGVVDRSDLKGAFSAFDASRQKVDRTTLMTRLRLDPARPTIAVMSHAFPDSPHIGSWDLYTDYFVWLKETLRLLSDMPHLNVLVKGHPDSSHYGMKPLEAALVHALGAPHVKRLPPDINTASLETACDALVTVRGSVGLEFGLRGMPVILAGEAPYSGWGFTHEPRSVKDYADLLGRVGALPAPDSEARQRAALFAGLYYDFSRVPCIFLTDAPGAPWLFPKDWVDHLNASREALRKHDLDEDPAFRNFGLMLRDGHRHLMDHENA